MSSPFKVFRKNQKVLLAVACLLAMIAFVILPIFSQNLGLRQGGKNPVVARTQKYGDVTKNDLVNMHSRYDNVMRVMTAMLIKASGNSLYNWRLALEQIFGDSKNETLVNKWLIAHKADELGISVSDDAVEKFLLDKTGGKLTPAELSECIYQQAGGRYTDKMFFNDMREEVKVLMFQMLYNTSIQGMTPAQRWDYFRRVSQQAQIECIAVPVAPFAADIKKPDEETLKSYFEKYKDKVANPYSPDPGFRVPQKIEVAYFSADLEKFAAPENVTEDEIQACYIKDRKNYDARNKAALDREAKDKADKEAAERAKPLEGDKPAEETKPAEGGTQPAAPEGEKKDEVKKDDGLPATPPAPANPADKPADKPADNPAENAPAKSSSMERSPYRFASMTADEKKDQPEAPKADAPKADAPAAATGTDAPKSDKPAETPAGQTPATGDTQAKEPDNATAEPAASPNNRQLTEEVRKEIRQRIASEKISGIFDKLKVAMKEKEDEWRRYNAKKIQHKDAGLKEPTELDFKSLAEQYGIKADKTGLLTYWKAVDTEIGKSYMSINPQQNQQQFVDVMFDHLPNRSTIGDHVPELSVGLQKEIVYYLFWKTKDVKETDAKWEDAAVQQQVLEAWKFEQAQKPALEQAKKYAEKARTGKTTLKEAVAGVSGVEVLSPPPFTWLLSGYDPTRPQYRFNGDIKDLDKPGNDFMKTVFGLTDMDVGTAMNQPKTIAYAIQLEKYDPANDSLWETFMGKEFKDYGGVGQLDINMARNNMILQLQEEAGLKFEPKENLNENDKSPSPEPSPSSDPGPFSGL